MSRKADKSNESDVRHYRIKLVNIEFINQTAKENTREPAQQLNVMLDELRLKREAKKRCVDKD